MKGLNSLQALRFLIIGTLIFLIGCGGKQEDTATKELKDKNASVHTWHDLLGPSALSYLEKLKNKKDEKVTVSSVKVSNIAQEKEDTNATKLTESEIPSNVEQKEKILVTHVTLPEEIDSWDWCGSNAIVVGWHEGTTKGTGIGWTDWKTIIEWINIIGKKRVKISEGKNRDEENQLLGCTPDGKWVIYGVARSDSSCTSRWDMGTCMGKWDGKSIADVYRYEVSSGKKEKIGVMRCYTPFKVISPDGKRIFLGGQLPIKEDISMPEPKWETLYFKEKDWDASRETVWFPDSSGVVAPGLVEIFGNDGWSKIFETGLYGIRGLTTGKDNRVYFLGLLVSDKWCLYKGRITQDRTFSYKKILEEEHNILNYTLLPNEDIIVVREDYQDKWLCCINHEQMEEKWVVKGAEYPGSQKISSDGRWLAFIKNKRLYLVKLK